MASGGDFDFDWLRVPGAFTEAHGLCRPQWKVIHDIAFSRSELSEIRALWTGAQRSWLTTLAGQLGPRYRVVESERFLLLHPHSDDVSWIIELADTFDAQINSLLQSLEQNTLIGKTAILILSTDADFLRYMRYYAKDGRPQLTAASCIFDGDVHVAIAGFNELKIKLVHEMTHLRLAHLSIPLWLHEGISMYAEKALVIRSRFVSVNFERERQRSQWRVKGIQPFWSGAAFHGRNDERVMAAYALAEKIVERMFATDAKAFATFVHAARVEDAGQAASLAAFDRSLSDWVWDLIGEGNWVPRVEVGTGNVPH